MISNLNLSMNDLQKRFYYLQSIFLSILFITSNLICFAQNDKEIIVEVSDFSNNPLEGALVAIETKDSVGLQFAFADYKGMVGINVKWKKDLYLKISAPEFKSVKFLLPENQTDFKVILEPYLKSLPGITIKGRKRPHIISRGDSLLYSVKDFETNADRTIGDILQKLPGIEINNNGSISFRGKTIGSLKIDGDDLLGGRYGIATSSIPASMVDSIQVIDHDQPIRVLQGIEEGQQTAINLVLKPKARLIWTNVAEVKAGLPLNYSANVSNMAFKPSFKTLNILSAEKNGKDYNDEANSLAAPFLKPWIELNNSQTILNDNRISFPQLPKLRWLYNQGYMANLNNLIKIKPEHSLNLSAGFVYQNDEESLKEKSKYFLPSDTVSISNERDNKQTGKKYFLGIRNTINSKKTYLNNQFSSEGSVMSNHGKTIDNADDFSISQKFKRFLISNDLSNIRIIKNSFIAEISSLVSFENNPEQMNISPGVLSNIINNNQPYSQAEQLIQTSKFYTSNSLGIKMTGKNLFQKYNIGFNFLNQSLSSNLSTLDKNNAVLNMTENNGRYCNFKPFIYSEWSLRYEKQTLELNLLTSLPFIKYNELSLISPLRKAKIQLNPQLSFRTQVGKENKFDLSISVDNRYATIFDVYRGSILLDYLTLTSQDLLLENTISKNVSTRFDFQKSLKIFFANFGIKFSEMNHHSIYKKSINENIFVIKSVPFEYSSQHLAYFTGFSKYIFSIRTNLEFAYNGAFSKTLQYQNEDIFPVQNLENSFKGRVQKRFGKIAELNYKISFMQFISKFSDKVSVKKNSFKEWNHTLSINFTPNKKWLLNFDIQNKKSIQDNTISSLFADTRVRYTFEKIGLDVNFGINNITGQKMFEQLYYTNNAFSSTTIALRPRTFYMSTYFNF